jgi:limonene-1,2-epoxide hydrolase
METERVIASFIDAILNRNADAVAFLLADDVAFYDPLGSASGRKEVHGMFKGFFCMASSIKWEIRNKIIQNNVAMIEHINNITLQNGKKIVSPTVTIAEVDNGKIRMVRDYFDFRKFNDQMSA